MSENTLPIFDYLRSYLLTIIKLQPDINDINDLSSENKELIKLFYTSRCYKNSDKDNSNSVNEKDSVVPVEFTSAVINFGNNLIKYDKSTGEATLKGLLKILLKIFIDENKKYFIELYNSTQDNLDSTITEIKNSFINYLKNITNQASNDLVWSINLDIIKNLFSKNSIVNFIEDYKIENKNCSTTDVNDFIECISNNLKKDLYNLIDKKYSVEYITGADPVVKELLEKLQSIDIDCNEALLFNKFFNIIDISTNTSLCIWTFQNIKNINYKNYRINLKKINYGSPLILNFIPIFENNTIINFNDHEVFVENELEIEIEKKNKETIIEIKNNDDGSILRDLLRYILIEYKNYDNFYGDTNILVNYNMYNDLVEKCSVKLSSVLGPIPTVSITDIDSIKKKFTITKNTFLKYGGANNWVKNSKNNYTYNNEGIDPKKYLSIGENCYNTYFGLSNSSQCQVINEIIDSILSPNDKTFDNFLTYLKTSTDFPSQDFYNNIDNLYPPVAIKILKSFQFRSIVVNNLKVVESYDVWCERVKEICKEYTSNTNLKKFLEALVNHINTNPGILNPTSTSSDNSDEIKSKTPELINIDWKKLDKEVNNTSFWNGSMGSQNNGIQIGSYLYSPYLPIFTFNMLGGADYNMENSYTKTIKRIYDELLVKLKNYNKTIDPKITDAINSEIKDFEKLEQKLFSSLNDFKNALVIYEIIDDKKETNITQEDITKLSNTYQKNIKKYDNSCVSMRCLADRIKNIIPNVYGDDLKE